MRKWINIFLNLFLFASIISSYAQKNGKYEIDENIWSRIRIDADAKPEVLEGYQYEVPPQVKRIIHLSNTAAIVEPNFRPYPTNNTTQSEMSIDIHPTNNQILLLGANATPWPVGGTIYGTGTYWTLNGGTTFGGFDDPQSWYGRNNGDPAAAIGANGNFYMGFIDAGSVAGQGIAVSTNNGTSWTKYVVAPPPNSSILDKNHLTVDKKATSPYVNRLYAAWTNFGTASPNYYRLEGRYSSNNGQTWSSSVRISGESGQYLDQGVNLQTGPNGEVYAVWAIYDGTSVTNGEDAIGFNVSTDGGATWGTARRIYSAVNFGIRGNLTSKGSIRVSSFPVLAVDRNTGMMYVTWPQRGVAPAGSDPDIVCIRSTDGGTTWSTPVRVNQDPINNGKDQYYPWATVDQSSGHLYIVYYDSRNVANDSAQVYVSRSIDGGLTFEDVLVMDSKFKPATITGLASGYQGDYIGVTAANGTVYPLWADNRTGVYQGWMTKVIFATYPLNAFNLNNPSAGTTISSFPNSNTPITFTWDTSSSTASYKWIFGYPNASNRNLVLPAGTNSLTITLGQLDNILAGLGVNQGDSLVGQWDVWAYRNNAPDNDSLKAANGPRALVLKRGVPQLNAFNLSQPANGTTIVTSGQNTSQIQVKWTKSGEGVFYKWKFASPDFSGNTLLNVLADGNGFDTTLTFQNSTLNTWLSGLGLLPGDSVVGKWRVYAYRNPNDSASSVQTYDIILKRQALGDVVVVYDSTAANGRIGKDTVLANLNLLGITYDLINRGSTSSTTVFSLSGYKKVIWLGVATSVVSTTNKEYLKNYLLNPGIGGQKAKVIIFGEDVGYQLDRTGSTYLDTTLARVHLGFRYVADRPGAANKGIVGITLNPGLTDSIFGTWPDVLARSLSASGENFDLYRFRLHPDSINSVGKIGATSNTAVFGFDAHQILRTTDSPPGSSMYRILKAAIDFVDEFVIPVELTSFTAEANDNTVSLNWKTATETNNSGFEVERKIGESEFKAVGFVKGAGTTMSIQNYSFVDKVSNSGQYTYRLKQIDFDGTFSYSPEVMVDVTAPLEFSLSQNYPNPFNPVTVIKYTIPTDSKVLLTIYNTLGEKVATLVNEMQKAGRYEVEFNASKYSSGVYFYRIESGSYVSVKKMMILK